jgi:hypothetical protein
VLTSLCVHVHTLSCLLLSDAYVAVAVDLRRDDLVFDDLLHSLSSIVPCFARHFFRALQCFSSFIVEPSSGTWYYVLLQYVMFHNCVIKKKTCV